MIVKIKSLLVLVIMLLFVACKKDNEVSKNNVDVYVVGQSLAANGTSVATYWRNGKAIKLTDSTYYSQASSIFIEGQDVYIAGYITNSNGYTIATYWKNGVMTKLTDGTSNAEAYSIKIQGNNLFVLGNTNIIYPPVYSNQWILTTPTLWKNGITTTLPNSLKYLATSGTSMASNGNVLYIAGNYIASNNKGVIAYWENGTIKHLTDSTTSSTAIAITANGKDIYVAGVNQSYDKSGNPVFSGAAYWKNDVVIQIGTGLNSQANDITVSNGNVYVAGTESANSNFVATYWKNGTAIQLGNASINSYATAIVVNNGDVYVAGQSGECAIYWKNGVLMQIAAKGLALAIAVAQH